MFIFMLVVICSPDPSISVEVLHHLGLNELFYYCDVHPEPNTDYNYTIQWYLSTEASIKTEIKQFDSMKLTDSFRNLTAMTESILRKNGIEEFPYVVSTCKSRF